MENNIKKRGLGFYFRIYFKIIGQDIKSKMSYRSDFIISTFGMIATSVAGFASFWILFSRFPSINGWDYNEIPWKQKIWHHQILFSEAFQANPQSHAEDLLPNLPLSFPMKHF